jgi:hypothetical protein
VSLFANLESAESSLSAKIEEVVDRVPLPALGFDE